MQRYLFALIAVVSNICLHYEYTPNILSLLVATSTASQKKLQAPKSQKSWRKCEIWETSCFGCTSTLAFCKEILIMLMSSALAFELYFLIRECLWKSLSPPLPLGLCVPAEPWGTFPMGICCAQPLLRAQPGFILGHFSQSFESKRSWVHLSTDEHTGSLNNTHLFLINGNQNDPMHKLGEEYRALSGTPLRLHRKF